MNFRIESVVTHSKTGRGVRGGIHPLSGQNLRFAELNSRDDRNWFTIVLGKNSIGKSQLLSDIAEALCIEIGEFTSRRSASLNISLTAVSGDKSAQIDVGEDFSQEKRARLGNVRPNRIVASATTPFDKFRLSKDVIRERAPYREENFWKDEQQYHYTGLRDANGRTNFRSSILRTIRGIFLKDYANTDQFSKLRLVFEFLGLRPTVQLAYSIAPMSSSRRSVEAILSGEKVEDAILGGPSARNSSRLKIFLDENPAGLDRVRKALTRALENGRNSHSGQIEIEVGHNANSADFLSDLFLLKDLRLLNFREVCVQRYDDGEPLDILEASSGEISIISGMLGIASGIQDSSLILIDEPEISLHPEWQDRYLELLRDTFSAFRGCHFIIATHSPIIVSDANKVDTTVLNIAHVLEGGAGSEDHFGKSIDEIIATQFGVIGDENLYVKQEVIKAANSVARGELKSPAFLQRIAMLNDISKALAADSKLAKVIRDLRDLTT